MRIQIVKLALVLSLIAGFGCTRDNQEEKGDPNLLVKVEDLIGKFDKGIGLSSVEDATGSVTIKLSDGSYYKSEKNEFPYLICDDYSWPVVTLTGTTWYVNGSFTGKGASDVKQSIVAAYSCGERLYVRCSSGKIIYFDSSTESANIATIRIEKCNNPSLDSDIILDLNGSNIVGQIPFSKSTSSLVVTAAYRGASLSIGGMNVESGITKLNLDGSKSVSIANGAGQAASYTLTLSKSKRLPSLYIETGGVEINSLENYVTGSLVIQDPDLKCSTSETLTLQSDFRGRGNSTWGMPKKPYKIKLANKSKLLGMSNDKEWALLANYSDKSLLRNRTVHYISSLLGMAWTPKSEFVEVYLNGQYNGLYQLYEQVKVSSERVNISLVTNTDNSGSAVTGDYLFEIDDKLTNDTYFWTSKGLPMSFKEPKVPTNEQLTYAKSYFDEVEAVLYGDSFKDPVNGYAKYIDIESFASNYIIQELVKNVDGNMRLSNFLVKKRDGKLSQYVVWDFDLVLGNCNYFDANVGNGPTNLFVAKYSKWYDRLLQDPAFVAAVKRQWAKLYPQLPRVCNQMRSESAGMRYAIDRNFQKWTILNQLVWPNVEVFGSYDGELNYMLNFLTQRANWLNGVISTW